MILLMHLPDESATKPERHSQLISPSSLSLQYDDLKSHLLQSEIYIKQ